TSISIFQRRITFSLVVPTHQTGAREHRRSTARSSTAGKPNGIERRYESEMKARVRLRFAKTRRAGRGHMDLRIPSSPLHPQSPKSSLKRRAGEAIDCALARSSALFFGAEKPWPVPP